MSVINLVCLGCGLSCNLTVKTEEKDILSIEGNNCKNGVLYAKNEFIIPSRVITTVIKVQNGITKTVPVKTEIHVPKSLGFRILRELNDLIVLAPINKGDIIKENICNTGVNIVATKSVPISS